MDVLDSYKSVWKNQPNDSQKVSKETIYKLSLKKSSSLIKWIFIIGILEFAFWISLNFLIPFDEAMKVYEKLHITSFINTYIIFNYIIIVIFLYLFYKNYTAISIVDNTKILLEKIIKTRKTVKYYVLYNVLGGLIFMIIFNVFMTSDSNNLEIYFNSLNFNLPPEKMLPIYIIAQVIFMIAFLLFITIFYLLLYGILLKKLNRNYKEF